MKETLRNWTSGLSRFEQAEESPTELLFVRLGLAFVFANNLLLPLGLAQPDFFFNFQYTEQPDPAGLARFCDLTLLADPTVFAVLKAVLGVMLVLFCLGVASPLSCGYILFMAVAVGSLRNSQGNTHHGTLIVGFTVLGHWLGYAWHWALRSEKGGRLRGLGGLASTAAHRASLHAARQLIVGAYVIAGVTKLLRSGPGWLWDSPNIAIQVLKIGHQHALDGNQAALVHAEWVVARITAHPHVTRLLLGAGLVAELLAFLALFNRRIGLLLGVTLLLMHLFIGYLMQLTFPLNEYFLCLYVLPLPWALAALVDRIRPRTRRAEP